jgi:hypothetical protein
MCSLNTDDLLIDCEMNGLLEGNIFKFVEKMAGGIK